MKKALMSRKQEKQKKRSTSSKTGRAPRQSGGLGKEIYNPTWNPQYFKIARTFQFSSPSADVANFKLTDPAVTCSTTNLAYATGVISFAIDAVPNITELGALFDQYKIEAVDVLWDYITSSSAPTNATAPGSSASYQSICTLVLYEDNDDTSAPAATNAGWQSMYEVGRQVRKTFPNDGSNSLKITIKPKPLVGELAYSDTTALTGRALAGDGWIDGATANPVLHFGLKYAIQANPATVTLTHTFRLTTTFYTRWRGRQ